MGTSATDTGLQAGVAYTLGDVRIFGLFEQLKYRHEGSALTDLSEYKRNAWGAGLKWNLASGYIGGQYLQANNASCSLQGGGACNANESGARLYAAGYFHNMSKQTQVYLVGSYLGNDDLANYRTAGIGSDASGQNIGSNHTGVGIGIKHSF